MAYYDKDRRDAGTYGVLTDNSGSLAHLEPGANDVGSYQISGLPYAVSKTNYSDTKITFPSVTKWIQVISNNGAVSFSFIDGVATASSCQLPATGNSTGIMPIRTACMWITGNASVIAGLTNISSGSLNFDAAGYHP